MTRRLQEPEPDDRPGRLLWSSPKKLHCAVALAASTERKLLKAGTPPDVTSMRAKRSRHGKATADKWNQ